MKLKKILALACSLVMASSMFVATANAAVEGCKATLEFAGYEKLGTTTFAKIDVFATIPDTLFPYAEIEPDWVNTTDYTYEGQMLQGVGFDIPYVNGLTFVKGKSTAAEFITISDNKTDKKAQLSYAATGSYDTYYVGEINKLATLYYMIPGDVNAAYDVALSDAVIGLASMNADGSVTTKEYIFGDFAVTNTTVKPAEPEVKDVVINSGEKFDGKGYVWNVTVNKDIEAFGVKFYSGDDTAERDIRNMDALPKLDGGVGYSFNVGLKTTKTIDKADFTADGYTATWPEVK